MVISCTSGTATFQLFYPLLGPKRHQIQQKPKEGIAEEHALKEEEKKTSLKMRDIYTQYFGEDYLSKTQVIPVEVIKLGK